MSLARYDFPLDTVSATTDYSRIFDSNLTAIPKLAREYLCAVFFNFMKINRFVFTNSSFDGNTETIHFSQCPLKEDYSDGNNLTVRLPGNQTIYDINYISIFCYEYAVDFGHIYFNLSPKDVKVPPYIPPIREEPPKSRPTVSC